LRRSVEAEAGRASRVVEPVVYQRLQVRRRAAGRVDSLAWEIWDDAAPPAEAILAAETPETAEPGRNEFEKRLARYFAARGESRKDAELKIAELSNAVVAETSAAMSEAWALKRLASRFTAEREREITPAARRRIEEMLNRHTARLTERARALRMRLEPALTAIAGGATIANSPTTTGADWRTQALMVFDCAERVHQLAGRLFTSAGGMSAKPEQSARQTLDAVAGLDAALQALALKNH